MRTIKKIITEVSCKYGAPMGRPNHGPQPLENIFFDTSVKMSIEIDGKFRRVYDCAVPMSSDGAYDRGGAYWGIGAQLRVQYTKCLSFIRFYRLDRDEMNRRRKASDKFWADHELDIAMSAAH